MRLALVLVLSLALSGCALLRKDKEEPVEAPRREREKAGPVLKPSDVMKPDTQGIASPVSDRFAMRLIYFQPSVNTDFRLDSTNGVVPGTLLNAERDLGLDDQVNQGRMEVDMRMRERHHMRVDYFKLSRFKEQPLVRDIDFGDFGFDAGQVFRTKLDWRVFSVTYGYEFFKFERFEAGLGLGIHVIQAEAEGGRPGTLQREKDSEVGIFPTIAANAAFRISKRWSVTLRGQQFSASPEGFDGSMSDYHLDLQYRWHRNLAIGLGYTKLEANLEVTDTEQPLMFDLSSSGPEIFFRASF
ncbi:MAG TPA: hypothetical protein VMF52_17870 [Steroidobacteraceae bacterium]|nr:hypothetical protein [Steroidobacteraceae bacterium]